MRKAPANTAQLLTIPVAATEIGVKVNQLRAWVEFGIIPSYLDGKTLKLSQSVVQEWKGRISKNDLPDMECVPEPFRLQSYVPKQQALLSGRIIRAKNNRTDVAFDEFFKEKNL